MTPGINARMTLNRWLWLGLFGRVASGEKNYTFPDQISTRKQEIWATLYGLEFGANVWSAEIVHFHLGLHVGRANIRLEDSDADSRPAGTDRKRTSKFTGYEPEIQIEINMTEFLRVGIGDGYRLVTGEDSTVVSADKLRGFTSSASLKFVFL